MNNLLTPSEVLSSQMDRILNQPSYLNIQSVVSNLALPAITFNSSLTECICGSINKLHGVGISTISLYTNNYFSEVIKSIISKIDAMNKQVLSSLAETIKSASIFQQGLFEVFKDNKEFFDRILFMDIAEEIGFPVYMEIDTELQHRLLESYRVNDGQCNREEMCEIILDYYSDDYVDQVLNGIQNVGIFNNQRVKLIREGIEVYQLGYYGTSATAFTDYISGMIRDIYKEVCTMHSFTQKEKNEILACFDQRCKPDSEKGMLLQIVCSQDKAPLFWHQVVSYFLNRFYSSGEHGMNMYPKRHMMCHGIQMNHNTKEMNLILLMCMDIISELAWRVRRMKEEDAQIVINL